MNIEQGSKYAGALNSAAHGFLNSTGSPKMYWFPGT